LDKRMNNGALIDIKLHHFPWFRDHHGCVQFVSFSQIRRRILEDVPHRPGSQLFRMRFSSLWSVHIAICCSCTICSLTRIVCEFVMRFRIIWRWKGERGSAKEHKSVIYVTSQKFRYILLTMSNALIKQLMTCHWYSTAANPAAAQCVNVLLTNSPSLSLHRVRSSTSQFFKHWDWSSQ
jgi:hypothetical protein